MGRKVRTACQVADSGRIGSVRQLGRAIPQCLQHHRCCMQLFALPYDPLTQKGPFLPNLALTEHTESL